MHGNMLLTFIRLRKHVQNHMYTQVNRKEKEKIEGRTEGGRRVCPDRCLDVASVVYVKRETDVRKKKWLSGQGLFANRPADTVRSLLVVRKVGQGTNRLSGHGPYDSIP